MTQLCDVYSPEAVGTLIHGNRYGYLFSLLYVKYIFFSFYRSVGFEENIKYTKKFITPAMELLTLQLSLWLREYDRAYFASLFRQKRQSLIYCNFASISCGFRPQESSWAGADKD